MPTDETVSGAAQVTVTFHKDHVETLIRILSDPETNISDEERSQIITELEHHT